MEGEQSGVYLRDLRFSEGSKYLDAATRHTGSITLSSCMTGRNRKRNGSRILYAQPFQDRHHRLDGRNLTLKYVQERLNESTKKLKATNERSLRCPFKSVTGYHPLRSNN
jgi:hypothetical protein